MSLKELSENRGVAARLSAVMAASKTVHAFLFLGGESETLEMGRAFAKALLCPELADDSCDRCPSCLRFDSGNHEDFIRIARSEERRSITVSQIQELQASLMLKPVGKMRAVIIEEARLMSAVVQNKLLKTLEEPPENTVLILLSESKESLLPTVISRCSCYHLRDSPANVSPQALESARNFAALMEARAPFYRKKECIEYMLSAKDESRELASEFLPALEEELHARLLAGDGDLRLLTDGIRRTEEAIRNIKMSYNTAYVLKGMCLNP